MPLFLMAPAEEYVQNKQNQHKHMGGKTEGRGRRFRVSCLGTLYNTTVQNRPPAQNASECERGLRRSQRLCLQHATLASEVGTYTICENVLVCGSSLNSEHFDIYSKRPKIAYFRFEGTSPRHSQREPRRIWDNPPQQYRTKLGNMIPIMESLGIPSLSRS